MADYRAIKLPLNLSQSEKENLLKLIEASTKIYQEHIDWIFANKSIKSSIVHAVLYKTLKTKYPNVPAGLIQSTRDQAIEAYKSLKKQKWKTKPVKSKYSSLRFNKTNIRLAKNLKSVTFSNNLPSKRISKEIVIPTYFKDIAKYENFRMADLLYRKNSEGKYIFYIVLVFKIKPYEQNSYDDILGIDRGINNIVALSNGTKISSKKLNKQRRKIQYLRSCLQKVGSRSAKRHLRRLSGKEKRYTSQVNHEISKEISRLNCKIFVLESLAGITRNKNRGKSNNRKLFKWPFYQFEQYLIYKAEFFGKKIAYINPAYTSQKCSFCGFTAKANRKGSRFQCGACKLCMHADLNAAINIRNSHRAASQLDGQGVADHPIVSNHASDLDASNLTR